MYHNLVMQFIRSIVNPLAIRTSSIVRWGNQSFAGDINGSHLGQVEAMYEDYPATEGLF